MTYRKQMLIISIFSIVILCLVATYAYFTTEASSSNQALKASTASFSLSLEVTPEYTANKLIPMLDSLVLTGYNNGCIDVNEFNVCQAYKIKLSNTAGTGQQERLLGVINFGLNHIENLSYMLLDEGGNTYKNITSISHNTDLSLGDFVELNDGESKDFTLIIWLSDTGSSQNNEDAAGTFSASITYTGVRGEDLSTMITGTIN